MLIVAFVLFALALLLLWISRRGRKAAGLPEGRVIYGDTREWGRVAEALFDPQWQLTGKPDYLVKQGKQVIPVEVKTGRTPETPFESHVMQLAAYCRLVAREYGGRPPYGILHYPERTFAVDYTPELEAALAELLDEMRAVEVREEVARSHDEAARCRGCGYREICEQRL